MWLYPDWAIFRRAAALASAAAAVFAARGAAEQCAQCAGDTRWQYSGFVDPACGTGLSVYKGQCMMASEDECSMGGRRAAADAAESIVASAAWRERVGDGLGVWVSVDEQMFRVVRGSTTIWEAQCSTSAWGTGQQANSNRTPLGWHTVAKKIGRDAAWGQVFRAREPTDEIWRAENESEEDLVLTRILVLAGDEPGFNLGDEVDSQTRCIYVHGTNQETRVGLPASHGCIRLRNDDAIAAFDMIPEGTPLVITEQTRAVAEDNRASRQ